MIDISKYRASIGIFNTRNGKAGKPKRNHLSSKPVTTRNSTTLCLNVVLSIWLLICVTSEITRESPGSEAHSTPYSNPVRIHSLTKPGAEYSTLLLNTNWFLTAVKRNKLVKTKNGNRSNKSNVFTIGHWNAGAAHYQNKHSDIEAF